MDDTPAPVDAKTLKFLRLLVTVLTATMILGLLVIIVLFVTRFPENRAPLPESITLPDGTQATAFTRGADWYAVVTQDNRILIYGAETGALLQDIEVTTGQ